MSRDYVLQPFRAPVDLQINYSGELNEQQLAAFNAYGFGHGLGNGYATRSGNEGQSDVGVAQGGFDQFLAGAEKTLFSTASQIIAAPIRHLTE